MAEKSIFILGVALLTWGGVFLYLLRVAALAKRLETELKALLSQKQASPDDSAPVSLP